MPPMLRRQSRAETVVEAVGQLVLTVNGIVLSAAIAVTGIAGSSAREENFMAEIAAINEKVHIGIDPSIANTGVAVINSEGNLIKYINGRDGCHGKYTCDIEKYVAQAEYIIAQLSNLSVGFIAYESYSYQSTHKAYSLAECNGILKASLFSLHPKPLLYMAPMRLKKFATGNGHADKSMMIARAKAECSALGSKPTSDICDAFFLAKYAFYVSSPQAAYEIDRGNANLRIRLELATQAKEPGKEDLEAKRNE